jgi:hypothetical protein
LPLKERKKQRKLKRRLLRKRLRPMLHLAYKAFQPGYESVCVLMLEGVISQLEDPAFVIQTASVQKLSQRMRRFVKKHGDSINQLLYLSVKEGTPTTTNALESKNSIFKPFALIAKFFPMPDTLLSAIFLNLLSIGLWINLESISSLTFNKFAAKLGHYEYPKKCVPTQAVSPGNIRGI